MLRILQLYYEPIESGQTTHVLSLTEGLVRKGHQVEVALPYWLEGSIASFMKTGAKVLPLEMKKVFWKPGAISELIRQIRKNGYNIIHIHSQEAGLVARPLARLAGAGTLLYTPQTIDIRQKRWQGTYTVFERVLGTFTSCIVSVNERDRQRLNSWGIPESKLAAIPNGINLERFKDPPDREDLLAKLEILPGSPIVMQVGRLSPQKNPLAFVEGVKWVLDRQPQIHFIMVGEGPLLPEIRERINDLCLRDRLHLTGRREDAWQLIAAADVITLTSLWEGTPYSLLEAMAWSKPVVATDVNGCRELVLDSETGFLCLPGEVESWGKCVLKLVEDPDLQAAMGRRGRQRVERFFELKNMVSSVENLYYNLLGNKGA